MKTELDIVPLLDKACEFITSLQTILKSLDYDSSDIEDGLFQQCLDNECLYVKKIPKVIFMIITQDNDNVFRALSDAIYFTQSQFKEIKKNYISFLKNYSTVKELNMLLTMLTSYTNVQDYIGSLIKGYNTPLVDIALFCIFTNSDIMINYMSPEGFSKIELKLESSQCIRVYLSDEGTFDTLYNKSYIKDAGFCQAILFKVIFTLLQILSPLTDKKLPPVEIYQNLEYTQWKSDQREDLKNIPWIIPECSENTEDLYSPIRSVSDTGLWCFTDKSGKNSAISPFIPIPTEPFKSSPIRALTTLLRKKFELTLSAELL